MQLPLRAHGLHGHGHGDLRRHDQALSRGLGAVRYHGRSHERAEEQRERAVGVLALYLVTAAVAASSPRGNRLVYQEGDMRSFARSSRGGPAMAAAPEMMMMEDAAMEEPQMMRTSMKSARYSRGAPGSSLG